MKRILILMLCLCLVACVFVGCDVNGLGEGESTTEPTSGTTTDNTVDDAQYALSNILATDYSQYVTLGQYKDIEIKTDSDEYQTLRKQYIEYYLGQGGYVTEYEDREVADGDTVNIDYVGYCDDVAFEGGDTKGQGANLTIGSGSYIDDFEQQLIGSKPGDTVDVYVTFPEDYGNDELNGKDAHFVVEVNYIASAPIYPDLEENPDILKECFKYDTMDEFEEGIKDEIAKELVLQIAMDNMTVNTYPKEKLESTRKEFEDYYGNYAQMYGATLEEFIEAQGIDLDEVSKNQVKNEMFYLAIAQAEGMNYTDEEYEELCEDYAIENGYASLDALLESVASSYSSDDHAKYDLSSYLLQERAKKVIIDSVNVVLVK